MKLMQPYCRVLLILLAFILVLAPPLTATTEEPSQEETPPQVPEPPQSEGTSQPTVVYTPEEQTEDTAGNEDVAETKKPLTYGSTIDIYYQDKSFGMGISPFIQYYKNNLLLRFDTPVMANFYQDDKWQFAMVDNWGFSMDPNFWNIYRVVLDKVGAISYSIDVQDSEIFSLALMRDSGRGLHKNGLIGRSIENGYYRTSLRGRLTINTLIATIEAYTPSAEYLTVNGAHVAFHSSKNHSWEAGASFAFGGSVEDPDNKVDLFFFGLDGYIPLITGESLRMGISTEVGLIAPLYEKKLHWDIPFGAGGSLLQGGSLDNYYGAVGFNVSSTIFQSHTYVSFSRSIHRGFFDATYRGNMTAIHQGYQARIEASDPTPGPYILQVETDNHINLDNGQQIDANYLIRFGQNSDASQWIYHTDQLTLGWELNDYYQYNPWYASAGLAMENFWGMVTGDESFSSFLAREHTYLYGKLRVQLAKFLFLQGSIHVGTPPIHGSIGVTLRF